MTVRMITGKGESRRTWELVKEKRNLPPVPPPPRNDFLKEGDTERKEKANGLSTEC